MEALDGGAVDTQIFQGAVGREQMLEVKDILRDGDTVSCGHNDGQLGLPYPGRIHLLLVVSYGPGNDRHRTAKPYGILVLKRVRTETALEDIIQHDGL